jgi:hypothetical protein
MPRKTQHRVRHRTKEKANLKSQDEIALEEYKLIQTKIDNIGSGKLKIKTWSVTITAAALAGAKVSGISYLPTYQIIIIIITFMLIPIIFSLMEGAIDRDKLRLGKRALQLELYFLENAKKQQMDTSSTPNIARLMHLEKYKSRRRRKNANAYLLKEFGTKSVIYFIRTHSKRLIPLLFDLSNKLFYSYQIVIIGVLIWISHQHSNAKNEFDSLNIESTKSALDISITIEQKAPNTNPSPTPELVDTEQHTAVTKQNKEHQPLPSTSRQTQAQSPIENQKSSHSDK